MARSLLSSLGLWLQYVALAVWIGGIVAIGAVTAPAAFHLLDSPQVAGRLVGEVLRRFNYVSFGCLGILVVGLICHDVAGPRPSEARLRAHILAAKSLLIGVMAVIAAILAFLLIPHMEILRPLTHADPHAAARFQNLHVLYTRLTMVNLLCGLGFLLVQAVSDLFAQPPHRPQ